MSIFKTCRGGSEDREEHSCDLVRAVPRGPRREDELQCRIHLGVNPSFVTRQPWLWTSHLMSLHLVSPCSSEHKMKLLV